MSFNAQSWSCWAPPLRGLGAHGAPEGGAGLPRSLVAILTLAAVITYFDVARLFAGKGLIR